jgi:hypothetical protein
MSCDLGDGEPFRAETKFSSKFSLCDNKWHNISALYDTHQVAIRIDDQPFVVAYAPSRNIGKLQTKSALYIGGLPGKKQEICQAEHSKCWKENICSLCSSVDVCSGGHVLSGDIVVTFIVFTDTVRKQLQKK